MDEKPKEEKPVEDKAATKAAEPAKVEPNKVVKDKAATAETAEPATDTAQAKYKYTISSNANTIKTAVEEGKPITFTITRDRIGAESTVYVLAFYEKIGERVGLGLYAKNEEGRRSEIRAQYTFNSDQRIMTVNIKTNARISSTIATSNEQQDGYNWFTHPLETHGGLKVKIYEENILGKKVKDRKYSTSLDEETVYIKPNKLNEIKIMITCDLNKIDLTKPTYSLFHGDTRNYGIKNTVKKYSDLEKKYKKLETPENYDTRYADLEKEYRRLERENEQYSLNNLWTEIVKLKKEVHKEFDVLRYDIIARAPQEMTATGKYVNALSPMGVYYNAMKVMSTSWIINEWWLSDDEGVDGVARDVRSVAFSMFAGIQWQHNELNEIKIVINNNFNKIDKIYQKYKFFHDTLEQMRNLKPPVVFAPKLGFDNLETPENYDKMIKEIKTKFSTNEQDSLNNLNVKVNNMHQKLIVAFKEISKIATLLYTTLPTVQATMVQILMKALLEERQLAEWLTNPSYLSKPKEDKT